MELEMENESPVAGCLPSGNMRWGGCLDHRSAHARGSADSLCLSFSNAMYFPQNLILLLARTACGHSVTGNLLCQLSAKWLWQGLR